MSVYLKALMYRGDATVKCLSLVAMVWRISGFRWLKGCSHVVSGWMLIAMTAYCVALISGCSSGSKSSSDGRDLNSTDNGLHEFSTKALLGKALFHDVNFSLNRTQACATCHNPEQGFVDIRHNSQGEVAAFSMGDDGISFGDRNTPSAAYASFSPAFGEASHARFNSQQPDYQGYVGGQFWDGRETNLAGQASGPPLNPIEMAMPDVASVVVRIKENEAYVSAFEALFGSTVFSTDETAYQALTEAIAAFEKTEVFAPFDSKYDRSLRGDYFYDPLTKAAEGKALFFSQQFTNCATCHQLKANSRPEETFTNYEYHNIGVPSNIKDRQLHGKDLTFVDTGLIQNPNVTDEAQAGKFKVPTLRNVAVTGPYMHNGVFKKLRTVVEFYDHFLIGSEHTINPETGLPWASPEVSETVSEKELEDGNKLTPSEVEAMVCFLRTLTDARYEHLIPEDGIDCGE